MDYSLFNNANEFTFTLPKSKNDITFKILTHKDERQIDEELKGLKKVKIDEIRIEHKHYDDIFMNKYFKMNGYETQFDPNDWSTIIAKKIR